MTRVLLYLLPVLFLAACVKAPEFPVEPVLTFESLDKNQIYQFTNGPLDSITIKMNFTDGDGDLSFSRGDSISDIFLEDSRLPGFILPSNIPTVPSEGTANGISGDLFFTIINEGQAVCCISNRRRCVNDPALPIDTFHYIIQIRDRAGNMSNKIRTPTIQIICDGL